MGDNYDIPSRYLLKVDTYSYITKRNTNLNISSGTETRIYLFIYLTHVSLKQKNALFSECGKKVY